MIKLKVNQIKSCYHYSCSTPDHICYRVFINGGAGGIGTFAIQYLKSQGCEVIVSVGEGRDIVESLNPDHILVYKSDSFQSELRSVAGYETITLSSYVTDLN